MVSLVAFFIHRVELKKDLPILMDVNVYLIGKGNDWILVDSGYGRQSMVGALEAGIKKIIGRPQGLRKIVVTHAHVDHFGGATVLKRRWGLSVALHEIGAGVIKDFRKYAELYSGRTGKEADMFIQTFLRGICQVSEMTVDETLRDGDELEVGGHVLRIIHTPGHSPCHICLYDPDERILFSGDLVTGEGGTWIGYPSGDVALYMESLRRIAKLKLETILPAHGPVIEDPLARIYEIIEQKEKRLTEIYLLIKEKPRTPEELARILYSRLPSYGEWLKNVVRAYIVELERRGKVKRVGNNVYEAIS